MPASDPPPASQPPASAPSQPWQGSPASADTITQALAAVVAAFPPDSSVLLDLRLTASDDTTVSLSIVMEDPRHTAFDDAQAVVDAIKEQFAALSIPQIPVLSFTTPDGTDDESPDSTPPSDPAPASSPPASG